MSPRFRLMLFVLAGLCVLGPALAVMRHMPSFGAHPLPYGDAINDAAPRERHVANMVSAVNFDYRGVDTLGEEFMLLAAVTGTTVLLRGARGEGTSDRPGTLPGRPITPRSDATVLVCRLLAPVVLLFGGYVVLHALLTPGGGFHGGAIIGSGMLLVFLGEGYVGWRRVVRTAIADACEGGGAALFALSGFLSLLLGGKYLQNVLPLGQMGQLVSGGLMLVENLGVGFAVAGGFTVLFVEFLEETRAPDEGGS